MVELDHVGVTVASLWDGTAWSSVPALDAIGNIVSTLRWAVERPDVSAVSRLLGAKVDRVARNCLASPDGPPVELLAFVLPAWCAPSAVAKPGAVHLGFRVPQLQDAVQLAVDEGATVLGEIVNFGPTNHVFVQTAHDALLEFIAVIKS